MTVQQIDAIFYAQVCGICNDIKFLSHPVDHHAEDGFGVWSAVWAIAEGQVYMGLTSIKPHS